MVSTWKATAGIAALLILAGQGCPTAPGQIKKDAMEKKGEENVVEQTYSIRAENQIVENGSVVIAEVNGIEATWVAIHAEDSGKPGEVIGHGLVAPGKQKNVSIEIDAAKATPVMFAMLHEDKGEAGVYEFPGADAPVMVDGQIVVVKFTAAIKARGTMMEKPTTSMEKEENDSEDDGDAEENAMRQVHLTAKRWQFEPASVTVKKGDKVTLSIKSIDVTHGFSLPDFNVSATLKPNETTVVEFTADKTGTFTFSCNVFCGQGHSEMKGTLVVEE